MLPSAALVLIGATVRFKPARLAVGTWRCTGKYIHLERGGREVQTLAFDK